VVDFHEIWYGGNAIQGDLDSVIFNPISSTILKWLRFIAVSWRHDFQPFTAVVWDCLIVELLWLHHIQSLANVTVAAIACNLLWGKNGIVYVQINDLRRESRRISSYQKLLLILLQ
jgi:hypothetical protein